MYIKNDDLIDLVVNNLLFLHGRIFTEFFEKFITVDLPDFLNMHIQNFTIFSQAFFKSFSFTVLIYYISVAFSQFKKNNLILPILIVLNFFSIFALILKVDSEAQIFDTLQFFCGYLFPIIFFLLLWYKLSDIYVRKSEYSKKDIIKLIILSILTITGNECLMVTTLMLFMFLLFDSIILRQKKNYIIWPFVFSCITAFCVSISPGFRVLYIQYIPKLFFSFAISDILNFLNVFYHKLIVDNIFYWILIVICVFVLFLLRKINKIYLKSIKFTIYSVTSFLTFFLMLYFLGETYAYQNNSSFHPYWILHTPLLIIFSIFLLVNLIYILGLFLHSDNIKKSVKVSMFIVFLFVSLLNIFQYYKNIDLSNYNNRKVMYIADKLAVFYFKQNKTAILPRDEIWVILPTGNNLFPKDLETDKYIGEIYTKKKYPFYFRYLENAYKMGDIEQGIIFKPYDEAMQDFYNNGGILTEEELEKLDFSQIR